jgi:predicted transcriptional regulator
MVDWKERPMPPVRGRSRHQRAGELVALNVRLPVAEARRLDRLAEARGITRGTAARQAILAWLDAARPDGRVAAGDLHASASWARRADAWEEA